MKLKYGPYSPSRLDTATCGYAFYRQYVDPQRSDRYAKQENLPQARGSAVHEVLEEMTKRMCASGEAGATFSEAQLRSWVVAAVTRHPSAYQDTADIMEMVKLYAQKPPQVLVADAKTELRFAVKLVLNADGSGSSFEECDYDDPEAWFRGRADIMFLSDDTTSAMVYDHKTQPNIEEADTPQMGFYAWVIAKTHPFLNEINTVLHFVRYGKYSEPVAWTKEMLAAIEDDIMTKVAIIENRTSWDPVPHKGCQYCPFVAQCPAMKEVIEVSEGGDYHVKFDNLKILGDTNKAVKLAGYINVMEEILKRSKDELKTFVKFAQAGIAIPGKVFEFRAGEEKVDWDKVNKKPEIRAAAYAIFEKYGLDPRMFMGFSQTFSKTVWMCESEALLKELSAIFPRTRETEFRGYKS